MPATPSESVSASPARAPSLPLKEPDPAAAPAKAIAPPPPPPPVQLESTLAQTDVSLLSVSEDELRKCLGMLAQGRAVAFVEPQEASPVYTPTTPKLDPVHGKRMEDYFFAPGTLVGLAEQDFKCWKCNAKIHLHKKTARWAARRADVAAPETFALADARLTGAPLRFLLCCWYSLCHYTGKYFCSSCHSNKKHLVPGYLLHCWDAEEKLVRFIPAPWALRSPPLSAGPPRLLPAWARCATMRWRISRPSEANPAFARIFTAPGS